MDTPDSDGGGIAHVPSHHTSGSAARHIVISTTPTVRGRPPWIEDRVRARREFAGRRWWDTAADDGPGIFLPWRQMVFRLAVIAIGLGIMAIVDALF